MSEERLKKIEQSLERLERGIFGDEQLDQWGVVKRQKDHERRLSALERVGLYIAGAAAVVAAIGKIVIDLWK